MADGSVRRRTLRAVSGSDDAGGVDPARADSWIGSGAVEPVAEPGVIGEAAVEPPAPRKERHLRLVDTGEPEETTHAADTAEPVEKSHLADAAEREETAAPVDMAGEIEAAASVDMPGQIEAAAPADTIDAADRSGGDGADPPARSIDVAGPVNAPREAGEQPAPARPEPGRRRHRRIAVSEEILTLLAIVGIGTTLAMGIDAAFGDLDGAPMIHPLVLLALPTWDLLPRNVWARMGLVAVEVVAIVGCWVLIAALGGSAAWRAAPSFGLACLLVGSAHVLVIAATARRRRQRADAVP